MQNKRAAVLTFIAICWCLSTGISSSSTSASDDALMAWSLYLGEEQQGLPLKSASCRCLLSVCECVCMCECV